MFNNINNIAPLPLFQGPPGLSQGWGTHHDSPPNFPRVKGFFKIRNHAICGKISFNILEGGFFYGNNNKFKKWAWRL